MDEKVTNMERRTRIRAPSSLLPFPGKRQKRA